MPRTTISVFSKEITSLISEMFYDYPPGGASPGISTAFAGKNDLQFVGVDLKKTKNTAFVIGIIAP